MSGNVHQRAEILRLAHLLRIAPERLEFLLPLDDHELMLFRDQVTDALFDAHTGMLTRLASAAKLLPAPVLAKIAEKVFRPLMCARIAGLVEPGKAIETAKRLSPEFLSDVAAELDPRRTQRIISGLPNSTVVSVAVELARREDWITLGRFVGHLDQEPLKACVETIDDAAVLRAAFAVEDTSAVAVVIDLLPQARRVSLVRSATQHGLWPTLLGVGVHLRDDQRAELAGVAAEQDAAVIDELVRAAEEHDLWDAALPFAAGLPTDAQSKVAELVGRLTPAQRATIAERAEELGLFADLGPIAEALEEAAA